MKIYKLDVTSVSDEDFDLLFDELNQIGEFSVFNGNILLLTNKEYKSKILGVVSVEGDSLASLGEDVPSGVVQWCATKLLEDSLKDIESKQNEVQEKTKAMYDIIQAANEKLKKGGGISGRKKKK